MLSSSAFLVGAAISLFSSLHATAAFNPRAYPKHTATCQAVRRKPVEETVDIQINYVDINPSGTTAILMVHGWPSVWSTWARQIDAFKNDYRLIVPNLRGFGDSTHPGDVTSSGTTADITGDLVCALKNAGIEKAICMGHDWGSSLCYEAARYRPDIFIGVIGAAVPYVPAAGPFIPVEHMPALSPKLAYQIFFNYQTEEAAAELNADIRRTMRGTLRTIDSPPPSHFLTSNATFIGAWDGIEIPPVPFFSPEEEDYYVEEMSKQGFKYTFQFYMNDNRHQAWQLARSQGNYTIPQPVLAVYPTKDPVADWLVVHKVLRVSDYLPNLTQKTLVTAHWIHLEDPDGFNSIVREWLGEHFPPTKDNFSGHVEL